VSASCSLHLKREDLLLLVQQVARRLGRSVQLIHEAHPAADHPRLPAVPELDYLKCLFFRVW
jgi:23S rRNA (cytosine1962-C5)-methyltransferase